MTEAEQQIQISNILSRLIGGDCPDGKSIPDLQRLAEATAAFLHPGPPHVAGQDWLTSTPHERPTLSADEERIFVAELNRLVREGRIVPSFVQPLPSGVGISFHPAPSGTDSSAAT